MIMSGSYYALLTIVMIMSGSYYALQNNSDDHVWLLLSIAKQ